MPTTGKRGRLFRRGEDGLGESDADLTEDEHAWWAAREGVSGVPRGNWTDGDQDENGTDRQKSSQHSSQKSSQHSSQKSSQYSSQESSQFSDYWTAESLFERRRQRSREAQAHTEAPPEHEVLQAMAMDLDAAHLVLQIKVGSSWDQITQAHRALAKLYHPDRLISWSRVAQEIGRDRMAEINAAHATLRTLHHR